MKQLKITMNEAGELAKLDAAAQADKFDDKENLGEVSEAWNLNVGDKAQKEKEPKLPIFDE